MPHSPLSPLSSSQASVRGVDGFATLQPRHRFQARGSSLARIHYPSLGRQKRLRNSFWLLSPSHQPWLPSTSSPLTTGHRLTCKESIFCVSLGVF